MAVVDQFPRSYCTYYLVLHTTFTTIPTVLFADRHTGGGEGGKEITSSVVKTFFDTLTAFPDKLVKKRGGGGGQLTHHRHLQLLAKMLEEKIFVLFSLFLDSLPPPLSPLSLSTFFLKKRSFDFRYMGKKMLFPRVFFPPVLLLLLLPLLLLY